MAHWRGLEEYSPFARILVEYMWAQRPPLLPAQFATRMRVRKQALSSWLSSDVTPPPPLVVSLARAMGLPVADLLIAAGYATPDDPLMDIEGAQQMTLSLARDVLDRFEREAQRQPNIDNALPPDWDTVKQVLQWLFNARGMLLTPGTPETATVSDQNSHVAETEDQTAVELAEVELGDAASESDS